MNSKLVTVLSTACGLLLLIILGEWFYASVSQQQLLNAKIPIDKKSLPDEMPSIDLEGQSEESYVDLVDRPLFIEGRRPVNEPPPDAAQNAVVPVKFDWVLNGVYTTKKGLTALLTRSSLLKTRKENYRRITEGALLDGWKLEKIKKDRVLFTQDSDQKELLLRKPKLKQAPSAPGNAPPPRQPGGQPEGVPPPEPGEGEEPEDLMQEPETPEELIENSQDE